MEKYLKDLLEFMDREYPDPVSRTALEQEVNSRALVEQALSDDIIVGVRGDRRRLTVRGIDLLNSIRMKQAIDKFNVSSKVLNFLTGALIILTTIMIIRTFP